MALLIDPYFQGIVNNPGKEKLISLVFVSYKK